MERPLFVEKPPLTNRGVTPLSDDQKTGVLIDWIRASYPWSEPLLKLGAGEYSSRAQAQLIADQLMIHDLTVTDEPSYRSPGYDIALKLVPGGSVRWHTERSEQMIGLEFKGEDLQEGRSSTLEVLDLLSSVYLLGGRITRLDLAIDVYGSGMNVLELKNAWDDGKLSTRARDISVIAPETRNQAGQIIHKGRTVYVGARSSEVFLRVYDKGLETGDRYTMGDWVRIELELKGRKADSVASQLLENPEKWTLYAIAVIREFCFTQAVSWYCKAVTSEAVEIKAVPRKETNRYKWLLGNVLPALESELEAQDAIGNDLLAKAYYELVEPYMRISLGVAGNQPSTSKTEK